MFRHTHEQGTCVCSHIGTRVLTHTPTQACISRKSPADWTCLTFLSHCSLGKSQPIRGFSPTETSCCLSLDMLPRTLLGAELGLFQVLGSCASPTCSAGILGREMAWERTATMTGRSACSHAIT